MKAIQITMDAPLLKALDRLSRARKTTRSALIRDAVAGVLAQESQKELETRHVEGYRRKPVKSGEFDSWVREQDWGPV